MFLLFHGKDEFSAREELARLRASGGFDVNQDTFYGEDADVAQIRVVCDTLPFLSERRLVVVLGLPKPKRGAGDDEGDDEPDAAVSAPAAKPAGGKRGKGSGSGPRAFQQALADYAPRTPDFTTLVVVVPDALPATSPLLQAAQKHGKVRQFTSPDGPRLEDWIARRAENAGASVSPDAARLLIEMAGKDLRLLDGEINKLATYVGQGGEIRPDAVRTLSVSVNQAVIFDLTDALLRRDRRRSLALLHAFLTDGQAPLAIVGMIASQTRALIQVKALSERGMRAGQIAETAGLAPYTVEKSLPLARQFSFAQLEDAHHALLRTDIALKSSAVTPEMALDLLTMEFGGAAERR